MKTVSVVRVRPQVIKAAAVSRALASVGLDDGMIHTGQYLALSVSDVFFDELCISKRANTLGVTGGSNGEMIGRMLEKINGVLTAEKPDWVLVDSDANSTLDARKRAATSSTIRQRLGLTEGGYQVATVHRAENTDCAETLGKVLTLLKAKAQEMPVVLPLHPRTRQAAARFGLDFDGLILCEPLGYLDMAWLVAGAAAVVTDSGGLQKEAYFHRRPCLTLRSETEWVETVEAGWNRLWDGADYVTPRQEITDYGDGNAAQTIAALLKKGLPA
jgi:UDP-N-acetylglucosamine 2-epimerase